jgi:serine/threonine protein phosphatase PrpC
MMTQGNLAVAHALACSSEPGEDRLGVFDHGGALVVVVADGAGGVSGGGRAADLVVELVRDAVAAPAIDPLRAEGWVDLLSRADALLEADHDAGEATGVVVVVTEDFLVGASGGDSGAWVVHTEGTIDDLTVRQHRKLRLGSGRARPVSFSRPGLAGTLLVATDGLLNYARREKIAALALQADLDRVARDLIELVRLPGGGLQDDVGVVLVRAGGGQRQGSAPGQPAGRQAPPIAARAPG